MNYSSIIFWLSIVLILYIVYLYYMSINTPVVASTTLSIKNANVVIPSNMTASSSRYTYGVWIYVNSWDNTTTKPIICREQSPIGSVPQISVYLDTITPTLFATIASSVNGGNVPPMTITDAFPLQKWTHVLISVDTQYVDMYIDGKLVKSLKLSYIPATPGLNTVPINIGQKEQQYVLSDIFLTKLQWWPNAYSPQAAWNEYLKGNNNSTFGGMFPYSANISISKDSVVQASYTI